MSWSIGFIGRTSKVVEALENESRKLDGQSKVEYDASLPHLVGLVKNNFEQGEEPVVKITAAGHGYVSDGKHLQRETTVMIERFYGNLV